MVISAGEKITLQAGGASLNVGPAQVLSNPEIQTGGRPESELAGYIVKTGAEQIINVIPGSKKLMSKWGGIVEKYVEDKLHLYEYGK